MLSVDGQLRCGTQSAHTRGPGRRIQSRPPRPLRATFLAALPLGWGLQLAGQVRAAGDETKMYVLECVLVHYIGWWKRELGGGERFEFVRCSRPARGFKLLLRWRENLTISWPGYVKCLRTAIQST